MLQGGLESMHLDGGFFQTILDEEGGDLGTLVSLELDDLSHFLIVDKSAVASEFLARLFRAQGIDRKKTIDANFLEGLEKFL